MEFYTASKEPRPVRLSEETRRFALESLSHKYGLDTKKTLAVNIDKEIGDRKLSMLEKYDIGIRKIAEKAPIRICDGEKISGAATLGMAIDHCVPVTCNGKALVMSVSHLTAEYESILKLGYEGMRDKAVIAMTANTDEEKIPFYNSILSTIDSLEIWHHRYLDALRDRSEYKENYDVLCRVPAKPASTFREAVQAIWFEFSFIRLCGNWPGFGRLDVLLGDYLKNDLASGRLTIDEAREILAHFFIKGCEWICGGDYVSGDAQHYQNIVLGGIGEDGCEVTNEVTYLILDIVEETGISDFPVTVRINKNSPEKLLRRTAEVMRHGGGVIAVYNEDLIINSLIDFGYDKKDAVRFANDGCWEVQIPGETYFRYEPFDSLEILEKVTLDGYSGEAMFGTYEDLYNKYVADLKENVDKIYDSIKYTVTHDEKTGEYYFDPANPCTVVSLFTKDCITRGLSYLCGGPRFTVLSPHIGGLPDTANALYAIKKLVYDEKKVTLGDFYEILKNNWETAPELRAYAFNKLTYYGNDNDEVDMIAARILDDFAEMCDADHRFPVLFPPGVSTFGRQIEWADGRLASPHGHKLGAVLAGNFSPTPGTDKAGATAIIKSYCKADLRKQVCGAALDISLLPSSTEGEDGINALTSLIRGFCALGGYFMQIDVVDPEVLKRAKEHPEDYQTLSVRVSGWNARFVTLCNEWQDMIIERDCKRKQD